MKRIILALFMMLAIVPSAEAQVIVGLKSLGFQQMSSLSAATALPNVPSGTAEAFIVCTGATVYWRDDGTAPTSSVGMPLVVNQPLPYTASIPVLQIIQSGGSATCDVTYYGY